MAAPPSPSPLRILAGILPTRRLLAVDAGSRTVKIILVEEFLGRTRILQQKLLEPASEDDDSREDCLLRVRALLHQVGDCPVALALPHYRALSQVLDLPSTEPEDVQAAITEESSKLSGLGESAIIHDFSALNPFSHYSNPFWVTFCQEGEVQNQIGRCGLGDLDLCEVTTTANALVAAYQFAQPDLTQPTALVDIGAMGTLVTLLLNGQPAYAASFAMGTELWAEILAHHESLPLNKARSKLTQSGFQNPQPNSPLPKALTRWETELNRLLQEWILEHPNLKLQTSSFTCILSGGGSELPNLLETLQPTSQLNFAPWPQNPSEDHVSPRFTTALGAALHALGKANQPASLLPHETRRYWRQSHFLQLLQSLLLATLCLLGITLGIATWHLSQLDKERRADLQTSRTSLNIARSVASLHDNLQKNYQRVRPILERQRETLDTLNTLSLLQQARSNQAFWYVLFSTKRDYYTAKPLPSTNPPPTLSTSNSIPYLPQRPGYIVELSIPETGETGRRIVSQLATNLRSSQQFLTVDSLPDDRRRPLADPEITLPEGHFALDLESLPNPFTTTDTSPQRRPLPLTENLPIPTPTTTTPEPTPTPEPDPTPPPAEEPAQPAPTETPDTNAPATPTPAPQ